MYQPVIGLEIHAELKTKTKIFCSCKNSFGDAPNTHVCPVCMGLPGTLPSLNGKVLALAVKAGLCLNCDIEKVSRHHRKNYFYPDLPKGYQISQCDIPICRNGYIMIDKKKIDIERIHIEEDAGKLIHNNDNTSFVDFNRCGVPLIEIVTSPCISSSDEAVAFLENLMDILIYQDISDCKMQEGSLRCDVNVSLKKSAEDIFNTRCEIKNLNSFSAVKSAIDYEIERQGKLYDAGKEVLRQTRRWDDVKKETVVMRQKETIYDYMYFPEPDLQQIIIKSEQIQKIKSQLSEFSEDKRKRFILEYGITAYDAKILTSDKSLAQFFEDCLSFGVSAKSASNLLIGDVLKNTHERGISFDALPFSACDFAELLKLIDDETLSITSAKRVLSLMFLSRHSPKEIVKKHSLAQISDKSEIQLYVNEVLVTHEKSVYDYKNGNTRAFGFLVGQAIKLSGGRLNPRLLNEILKETLDNLR